MWAVFDLLGNNLGMSIGLVILLALNIGLLMFYARGFKEGTLIMLLMNGLVSIWYYKQGWDWQYPLVLMFISLIMLCFSIFFIGKQQSVGVA